MNNLECPVCGSRRIKDIEVTETRQLVLGEDFSYQISVHLCETCGEEGDFSGHADQIRESAMEKARENLAKDLISSISGTGMKLAYIERAFGIPQRTISSKWGSGKVSASGLALLRIVKSMPWIVNIADHGFKNEVIKSTVHLVWENFLKQQDIPLTYSVVSGGARAIKIELTSNANQKNRLYGFDLGQAITSTD